MFQVENKKYETIRDDHRNIQGILIDLVALTKKMIQWIKEHVSAAQHEDYVSFNKAFLSIRQRLPRDIDPNFEEEMRENIIRKRMIKKTKNITKVIY